MSNLKRFLALTLAMLMVVGAMAVSAKSFTDVASTDSYAEAVDVLSELGVILGTSTDEFSPEALVSREQMAMFIARLATAQPALFAGEAGAIFKDQKDPTYNAAIQYAYTNGIIAGRTATEFDGPASVTLQEAAAMLSRAVGYGNKTNNASYPYSYMVIANEINLLKGLEEIAPTTELTRGEVATMLYNALSAPKAVRTLLYTPDGQDFVVSIPDGFYGVKDDDGNVLPFDTLATKTWKFKSIPSYIVATKDMTFGTTTAKTSKAISDPVIVKDYNNNEEVSFASLIKYLPEDATASELLGVDLVILAKGTKILKIDVVGDKTATSDVKYDTADGKKLITVDGTAYNLLDYADNFPKGDNCFYVYSNISKKIERISAASIPASFEQIKKGFFKAEVINAGADTQKIIIMPLTFGKVTEKDGKLQLGGKDITLNTVGAKKDDYVTFFSNNDNKVEVVEVATASAFDEVVKLNTTTNVATFKSGATTPATLTVNAPLNGVEAFPTLSLGTKYTVWTANGQVLKISGETVSGDYATDKKYYYVVDAGIYSGTDDLGAAVNEYRIKVVDTAGVTSIKKITKVDATDLAAQTLAVFEGLVENKVVVFKDTTIIVTASAPTQADFFKETTKDFELNQLTTAKIITKYGNIVTLDSTSAILTANSKIVLKTDVDKYSVFNGTNFPGIAETTAVNYYAIYHNNGTVNELVYLYAVATTKAATSGTDLYIFTSVGDKTATTVNYNAINVKTGAEVVLSFTITDTKPHTYATGAAGFVYQIVNGDAVIAATPDVNTEKVYYVNSAIVKVDAVLMAINSDTKVYIWNNTDKKFEAKTYGDLNTGRLYNADVISESNVVKYIVVVSTDSNAAALTTVATLSDTTPGTQAGTAAAPIAWEISVANAKATLALTDIVVSADASVKLYSDATFATEIVAPATLPLTTPATTTAYIKVTSQDLLVTTYYAVTITRAAA